MVLWLISKPNPRNGAKISFIFAVQSLNLNSDSDLYKVHWNLWTIKWHFLWKHFVTQLYRLKQQSERPQPENKQKIKTSQFSKKSKLKIICDFSTFFDTVKFDPLEEWLFRIKVGNLLLFRLKLRKFPKTFDSLNFWILIQTHTLTYLETFFFSF